MEEIFEIPDELLLDIKEEIEEPVVYPLPEEIVTADPIDFEIPSIDEQINQFCRLCLREQTNLVPLMSRIKDVTLPIMIQSITGIIINLRSNLPRKLCIDCVKKLDYAFNIQREFIENDKNLKMFARSRVVPLLEQLQRYQKGLLATSETYAEKLYREQRNAIRLRVTKQEDSNTSGEQLIPQTEESANDCSGTEDNNYGNNLVYQQFGDIQVGEPSSEKTPTEAERKSIPRQKKDSNKRVFGGFLVEINETEQDPNKCYICEHVTASNEELNVHLRSHADMVPYDCQDCSQQEGKPVKFTSVILLQRHFRMHAGSMKCPQCPFWTNTAQKLWSHINIKHTENATASYTCDICGTNVVGRKQMNRHMNAHKAVEIGRYQCSICQKRFSQSGRLERHVKTHSNESPYECDFCEKKYKTQDARNTHQRTHIGEYGHRCELCGKGLRTKSQLVHHMNAHNNVRPYTCEICGESFVRHGTLQKHQYKHSETLHFQCLSCHKRFRYDADHYKHVQAGCNGNKKPETSNTIEEGLEIPKDGVIEENVDELAEYLIDNTARRFSDKVL